MISVRSVTVDEARASAMRRLNQFFDCVYVLTIERNEERRRHFEADHPGLEFEYVYGVDGSNESTERLLADYDDEAAKRTYGRSLSLGQIGCALTHRQAYIDIVHRGHRNALLLEDDSVLDARAAWSAGAVLRQLPPDWDLLYLYTPDGRESRQLDFKIRWVYPVLGRLGIRSYDMDHIRATYSRPFSRNLRTAGRRWGAVAYGITAATAERLLAMQTPIADVADGVTRRLGADPATKAFQAVPPLFRFRAGVHSTIWNRPPRKR